jgi:hypothetical protein
MKRVALRWTVVGVVLVLLWAGYGYHVYIASWIWHLRHDSVVVDNHIVLVPKNWYVEDEGSAGQFLVRLDTDDKSPVKRVKAHAYMSVSQLPRSINTNQALRYVVSLEMDAVKKQGVNPILQTFDVWCNHHMRGWR